MKNGQVGFISSKSRHCLMVGNPTVADSSISGACRGNKRTKGDNKWSCEQEVLIAGDERGTMVRVARQVTRWHRPENDVRQAQVSSERSVKK